MYEKFHCVEIDVESGEFMDYCHCTLCPRQCGVDRTTGVKGYCGASATLRVARAALHFWEEPCISGERGSGTVFFTHCGLGCIFCQNEQLSRGVIGQEVSPRHLAEIFLNLQAQGAHNINLVTGAHYTPSLLEACQIAKAQGLRLPIVYNSSGYESIATLEALAEIVDIFLPDLKFTTMETGRNLANAPNYFAVATRAIRRMAELTGESRWNTDGTLARGLLVRHLILPGMVEESKTILHWIRDELPQWVMVSLMGQYLPVGRAIAHPTLNRRLRKKEYETVLTTLWDLGLENGYVQELSAAKSEYIPNFDLTGVD